MNIALQSYQTGVYFHARSACIHGRFAPRPVSENRYRYCHVEARSSFEVADSKGEEPGSADETGSVDLSLGLPLPLHNYQKVSRERYRFKGEEASVMIMRDTYVRGSHTRCIH